MSRGQLTVLAWRGESNGAMLAGRITERFVRRLPHTAIHKPAILRVLTPGGAGDARKAGLKESIQTMPCANSVSVLRLRLAAGFALVAVRSATDVAGPRNALVPWSLGMHWRATGRPGATRAGKRSWVCSRPHETSVFAVWMPAMPKGRAAAPVSGKRFTLRAKRRAFGFGQPWLHSRNTALAMTTAALPATRRHP